MPKVPDDAVQAAMAAVMALDDPDSLPAEELTRVILEAAAPVLAGAVAQKITAHKDEHEPKGPLIGGSSAEDQRRRTWRRHFGIAAQVASLAFSTDADLKRVAAEHLNAAAAVQRAREEISVQILAQKELCREHPMPFPKPSCWTCGRNGAFQRAAMIAAGLRDDLEAKELGGA